MRRIDTIHSNDLENGEHVALVLTFDGINVVLGRAWEVVVSDVQPRWVATWDPSITESGHGHIEPVRELTPGAVEDHIAFRLARESGLRVFSS